MEKRSNQKLLTQPADATKKETENDINPSEKLPVTEEYGQEQSFKRKLVLHVIICYTMFNIGWTFGMRGPVFSDLMRITGVSSRAGSVFVSANFVGMLIGSMLCGLVIDRYNRYFVMACASFGFGCANIGMPLCSDYWAMVLVNVMDGFGHGFVVTGCYTMCGQLWVTGASARSFMQSFQLCMPVGAILSPLVVAPFLSSGDPSKELSTNFTESLTWMNKSRISDPTFNDSFFLDQPLTHWKSSFNGSYISLNEDNKTKELILKDQRLIIPFSISGGMAFVITLLFSALFFLNAELKNSRGKNKVSSNDTEQTRSLSLITQILRLYLVGQFIFLGKGIENSFSQFFPIFLHSKMGWTKVLGSDIMSVYWGLYAFGRLSGVVISYYVKSSTHIFVDIFLLILAVVVLLVGAYVTQDPLMWLSAIAIGLATSTVFPCLISWSHNEILSRSGKHNSFIIVTAAVGSIVFPLIIGNMVEMDYIWFVYVMLIASILVLGNLICLFFFTRIKLKSKRGTGDAVILDTDKVATEMAEQRLRTV